MSYGINKAHHAIMKNTAVTDYNVVCEYATKEGIVIIQPKGKHWHRIEDATAKMIIQLKTIPETNRCFNYYKSIL